MKYKTTQTIRTTEERELRVPTDWGMYTDKGNRALTKISKKVYDTVDKLIEERAATKSAVRKALVDYLKDWGRLSEKEGTEEASDTAVREAVAGFHDKIWMAAFGDVSWDVWDENQEEAWRALYDEKRRTT